jgi:hypothetical protein
MNKAQGAMKGGRGLRGNHIYALYRGDTYLMDGTLEEIAEKRGVKRVTLQWMLRPSYAKRYLSPPKRVPKRQCLTLTRLDDDEDADEDA